MARDNYFSIRTIEESSFFVKCITNSISGVSLSDKSNVESNYKLCYGNKVLHNV